jgi:hypothetical protein
VCERERERENRKEGCMLSTPSSSTLPILPVVNFLSLNVMEDAISLEKSRGIYMRMNFWRYYYILHNNNNNNLSSYSVVFVTHPGIFL